MKRTMFVLALSVASSADASQVVQDPFTLPPSTIACANVNGTIHCVSHPTPLTIENVTASVTEARAIHKVLQDAGVEPKPVRTAGHHKTSSKRASTPRLAKVHVHHSKK